MKKIFFFAMILMSHTVLADVLFIDLNNSNKEIEAAKKAAISRGEKLIVLPQMSSKDQKEMLSLTAAFTLEKNKLKKQGCPTSDDEAETMTFDYEQCDSLGVKFNQLKSQREEISNRYFLDKPTLISEFKKLKDQKVSLSALVVSGHDGNAHFFGENANFNEEELREAFKKNSPLGDQIRSLMLWGCYTANIASISKNWKTMLPNVELIAGFDGSAPAGYQIGSSTYLQDVLTQEKRLTQIKDKKILQKNFKALKNVREMTAALCVGDSYVTNQVSLSLSEMYGMCSKIDYNRIKEIYECYKNASSPRCANPPENTSNSELRSIYNQLQQTIHCQEINFQPDLPSPDILIRLIFFTNVKANLAKQSKQDLLALDQWLKKLGAPSELILSDLASLSRGEFIDRLTKINQFLEKITGTRSNPLFNNPLSPEAMTLQSKMSNLQTSLGELAPDRIPFDWVEPNAQTKMDQELAITKDELNWNRESYETGRARHLIKQKLMNLSTDDKKTKELLQYKKEMRQIEEKIDAISSEEDRNSSEPMIPQLRDQRTLLYDKIVDLNKEIAVKYSKELSKFAETLNKEPYPNSEGKEMFNKALREMDYKSLRIE